LEQIHSILAGTVNDKKEQERSDQSDHARGAHAFFSGEKTGAGLLAPVAFFGKPQ
jgi:hypothetical protein